MISNISRRTFLIDRLLLGAAALWSMRSRAFAANSSGFGQYSTAEEVTRGINLTGKTALVTGCSSGIGYETMRVLALRGAHVLGLARTLEKATQACTQAVTKDSKGKATPLACEQSDFGSVVACADAVHALHMPIDMLICNAGIAFDPTLKLIHGVEQHFAINHLSHFILVNRLLADVKRAPQGRIVIVGSQSYRSAPPEGIDFDNLAGQRSYDRFRMYAQSKLANGLFARELAKRLKGTGITANVLHPGLIETNIFKYLDEKQRPKAGQFYGKMFVKNVQQGAATTCYVATSPALTRVSGVYFEDCNIVAPEGHMQDDALAAKLWAVSEELTRPYLLTWRF